MSATARFSQDATGLPESRPTQIVDVAPGGAAARAILTHGRSEMKAVRKLRRSGARSRALPRPPFDSAAKRVHAD